ncbi:TetR/AcrR family transcriptional regulator [Aliidiomarina soli]|uniref:TetR/AcrR family transcriptional regulator n=1 Tax=Aliidiomarina soli TaxID=1928574 RepID=A0A432WIY5_9GAMM|nr:TetR/AcrR family transcriptional regulator [Aliidiomarina soli]RUO33629.1 TetR/AcrR family transcriptional regulator [Aliidiomarina soli]
MDNTLTRDAILDAALKLGNETGWEQLTLYQVARQLNTSLAVIHAQFAQKDELVDAWLDRADRAMLQSFPQPRPANPTSPLTLQLNTLRLGSAMQSWLDALSPYHRLTGEMLLYKLEPGHIHLQAAGLLRISRTVQWFREAAELKASHLQRIGQEVALTGLFIRVFIHWLKDTSPQQSRTKKTLQKALRRGQRVQLWK